MVNAYERATFGTAGKGAMDERTMASFKTELFKRCLIQFDETADAVAKAVMAAFMEGLA